MKDRHPDGTWSGNRTAGSEHHPSAEDASSGRENEESVDEAVVIGGRSLNALWASLTAVFGLILVMMLTGRLDSLARDFMRFFEPEAPTETILETRTAPAARSSGNSFAFEDLEIHPDLIFQPYTAGPLVESDVSSSTSSMIRSFRALLDLYHERQGIDDNFTIRVVDNRTNEVLELYELENQRRAYENLESTDSWSWDRIDGFRRTATTNLVKKYVALGIPRGNITVKWGRKNQVFEARERELPFIEYETRLARHLGLSLLATEIGTVETFNNDRMVSPVGARSRYQMMPYVLRQNDVHHYRISTASGSAIDVYEEWHPLLTLEPAFSTLTGYKNAVGHEIPGISAYHTGPGNIFTVYRMFLTDDAGLFSPSSTVMDAYMWAVTSGYPRVSANSSFKTYSRGYVASIYGSLRATQSLPIDNSQTLSVERVQIAPGKQIFLSELLRALEDSGVNLDWGVGTEDRTLYDRFRAINDHFVLPSTGSHSAVDPRADVRLTAEAQSVPVRFFLPVGATNVLRDAGVNVIDESSVFTFSEETYSRPRAVEMTVWDRQYEALVQDIAGFGFTNENRRRLNALVTRFRQLADANPSHFRQMQLDIIQTHQRIWNSGVFDRLATAVTAAQGRARTEPLPPSILPSSSLQPLAR